MTTFHTGCQQAKARGAYILSGCSTWSSYTTLQLIVLATLQSSQLRYTFEMSGRSTIRSRGPQPVQQQSSQPSDTGTQVSSNAADITLVNPPLTTSTVIALTAPEPSATVTVQAHTGEIIAQWPVSQSKYVRGLDGDNANGISHLERQPGGHPTLLNQCPSANSHLIQITDIPPGWEVYNTNTPNGWQIGLQPEEGTYPPPL